MDNEHGNAADQSKAVVSVGETSKQDAPASAQDVDILAELRELGSQIAAAVKAVGESEQAQNLRRDISNGLRGAADTVGGAVHNLTGTDVAKGVKEQASRVTEYPVLRDIQGGIASALREMNKRLATFVESNRSKAESAAASDAEQLTLPGDAGDTAASEDKPTTKLNA